MDHKLKAFRDVMHQELLKARDVNAMIRASAIEDCIQLLDTHSLGETPTKVNEEPKVEKVLDLAEAIADDRGKLQEKVKLLESAILTSNTVLRDALTAEQQAHLATKEQLTVANNQKELYEKSFVEVTVDRDTLRLVRKELESELAAYRSEAAVDLEYLAFLDNCAKAGISIEVASTAWNNWRSRNPIGRTRSEIEEQMLSILKKATITHTTHDPNELILAGNAEQKLCDLEIKRRAL